MKATTPPGLTTRAHSAISCGLSGTWQNASWPITTSKLASANGMVERIAEPEVDQMPEPDQRGQPDRALVPALGDVEPGDPAAAMTREIARRPAHAAADVEDVHAGADAGQVGQPVDRFEPAEMVLVIALQHGLAQTFERHAVSRPRSCRICCSLIGWVS